MNQIVFKYKVLLVSLVGLVILLAGCSKASPGQDLAASACKLWQTAWSNSLTIYIGDARSQYEDFDAADNLAAAAGGINPKWKPIVQAISAHKIYAASYFDNKLFPDTEEQVVGMNLCKSLGIDVMHGQR